ncbi:hypothetical protein BT93_C1056 [Corymbia citriodora subsp. variegata]|nr:hypothetical protein BT93_C1056 [Corymbia citriodora subsp. variegata]
MAEPDLAPRAADRLCRIQPIVGAQKKRECLPSGLSDGTWVADSRVLLDGVRDGLFNSSRGFILSFRY